MNQVTMADTTWTVAKPGERVLKASVAINIEQGKLSISVGAAKLAGHPRFVRLLYSPPTASVAIVPTTSEDELGYAVVTSAGRKRSNGRSIGTHHQTLSRHFCRMLIAAGYRGTWVVPLSWHPDGMLWGDMDGARQRENKAKGSQGGMI